MTQVTGEDRAWHMLQAQDMFSTSCSGVELKGQLVLPGKGFTKEMGCGL